MNNEELAWAAGFLDGEGSIYCGNSHGRKYIALSLCQAEPSDLLVRFNEAVGGRGVLSKPRVPGKNSRKLQRELKFWGVPKVTEVVSLLWPWMGQAKRDQYRKNLKLQQVTAV